MSSRRDECTGRAAARGLLVAVLAAWTVSVRAADGDPPVDAAPSESATAQAAQNPAEVAAPELQALAAETVALMQQAQSEFEAGQLSEESGARQTAIVERLQQLAELARRQSASRSGSAGGKESPESGASQITNAGDGQGASTSGLDAAESSESAPGDAATATDGPNSARDLATSVWGHLPARERDRMQSRFSDRFLPQYDRLVRQYYEALATEGLSDE